MTKRTPAQYDWTKALFNDRRLTKHFTSPRRSKIKTITLHHMTIVSTGSDAGNTAALEGCYSTWQTREASANYGVAGDQVWQFVSDNDAAWANASTSNHETLSVEHANSTGKTKWEISDETMATGQHLVAALHLLYGLGRPTRKTVKVHQDYFATACPGPYMMAHLTAYIAAAGRIYDAMKNPTAPAEPAPTPTPTGSYTVVKGDTLSKIARAAKVTVANLAAWNAIKDPNSIKVGQVLRLTAPSKPTPPPAPKVNESSVLVVNCASHRNDTTVGGKWTKRHPILATGILESDASFIVCAELYADQRDDIAKAIASKYALSAVREGRVIFYRSGRWQTNPSWWFKALLGTIKKNTVADRFSRVDDPTVRATIVGVHLSYKTTAAGVKARGGEVKRLVAWISGYFIGKGWGPVITAGDFNAPAGGTTRTDDVGPAMVKAGHHDLGMEAGATTGKGRYHLLRVFGSAGVHGTRVVTKPTAGSDHPLTFVQFES